MVGKNRGQSGIRKDHQLRPGAGFISLLVGPWCYCEKSHSKAKRAPSRCLPARAKSILERHVINPVSRFSHRSFDGSTTWKRGPTQDW